MFFKMTIVLQRAETFNILQRAETFNMKSFILKIKTHFMYFSMRLTVYRKIVMFVHWYKY